MPGSAVDGLTFIGTATTLIRYGGFTLLTDPNFLHRGERAYLGLGLSSRRRSEPALAIADLPPLDAVVLSHHHGDHFDRRSAAGLDKALPIVTGPHAAAKLRKQGFTNAQVLRTWESWSTTRGEQSVTVTSTPAAHAAQPLAGLLPPVMGSVIDFAERGERRLRIYVTGDTLLRDSLADIRRRFEPIDLCVIHLGGTRVAGVLLTMDGHQGVAALRLVAPRVAVPVHFDDYPVFRSPLGEFRAEVAAAGLATEIVYLDRGQTHPL